MDKTQLAKWMHDEYEAIAKAENWQTQKITKVDFDNLPKENKATMLALADKMLNTFLIIDRKANVIKSVCRCKEGKQGRTVDENFHQICDVCGGF